MPTCCREVGDKGRKEDKPPTTPRYTLKTHYLWGHHELLMHGMPPNCRKESKRANTLPILTEPLPNMSQTITFQANKKKRKKTRYPREKHQAFMAVGKARHLSRIITNS